MEILKSKIARPLSFYLLSAIRRPKLKNESENQIAKYNTSARHIICD